MMKTVKVCSVSICPCGFPLMQSHVGLGDEYEINDGMTTPGSVICGGCKKSVPSTFVWVYAKGASEAGWLPKEIFSETMETKELSE